MANQFSTTLREGKNLLHPSVEITTVATPEGYRD